MDLPGSGCTAIHEPSVSTTCQRPAGPIRPTRQRRGRSHDRRRIRIEENSPLVAIIRSRGTCRQRNEGPGPEISATLRTLVGHALRLLRIQLWPVRLPRGTPWHDYVASRVRWSEQTREVRCVAHDMLLTTQSPRFDAPIGVSGSRRQSPHAIWTRGLPYPSTHGERRMRYALAHGR